MKKILYFAIAAVTGLVLAACQPTVLESPKADAPIASNALQSAFVIDGQYADAAQYFQLLESVSRGCFVEGGAWGLGVGMGFGTRQIWV